MSRLGIIGGSGLAKLENLKITKREMVQTPFGEPSGPLVTGMLGGHQVTFLSRHGYGHTIPPHKINYRANIWAFKELEISNIVAAAAVGGIRQDMAPGKLSVPDQIIDYTYRREGSYFDGGDSGVEHIDFTYPYSNRLRQLLISAAANADIDIADTGVYGVTEGPRLETAAEINKFERDGCTMVGMTAMPEAALARELEIDYVTCAFVVNWAAGRSETIIDMKEIEKYIQIGTKQLRELLIATLPLL
ncbi:MAG: S-methyl-5'-thioinosine phosphorylase [Thiotrichales bacterium]|jgi:5'-deoxy-5'-methylthioadenosine phosphorylase|nr:S-methyl-5'-thioinosine phosphorylase [Thiotrichales bacterium]